MLCMLVCGCSEKVGSDYGKLEFRISDMGKSAVFQKTKAKVSDYTAVNPGNDEIMLTIRDWDNEITFEGNLATWQDDNVLLEGSYSAELTYGTLGEEGQDKPYFCGKALFEISPKQTTLVNVNMELQNAIVVPAFGDSFKEYYSDIKVTLTTGSGNSFILEEGKALFVEAFRFEVSGTMTSPSGKTASFSKTFDTEDVKPKTCYTLMIQTSNIGAVSVIEVGIDDRLTVVELEEDIN